jgi:hypothetical protein
MYKQALTYGKADPLSQLSSDTIGRLANLGLLPLILGGTKPFYTPEEKKHKEISEAISNAEPDALSTTKLRLGAPNFIDDVLYAEDPTGKAPIHHRFGGRILQNPRTSLLMKALGYPAYPFYYATSSITRSPHYFPLTDVAHNPWDMPAVTGHELGHAIDFNTVVDEKGKVPEGFVNRQAQNVLRDLYGISSNIPYVNLYHEAMANEKSDLALRKGLNKKKYLKNIEERNDSLPAAYSTYVTGNVMPSMATNLVAPAVALATKAYTGNSGYKKRLLEQSAKDWDKMHNKKSASDKYAESKPGLWANIHAKRKRGESPAKPGDKDYPDSRNWKKVTKESSIAQLAKQAAASDYLPLALPFVGAGIGGTGGYAASKVLNFVDPIKDEKKRKSRQTQMMGVGAGLGLGAGFRGARLHYIRNSDTPSSSGGSSGGNSSSTSQSDASVKAKAELDKVRAEMENNNNKRKAMEAEMREALKDQSPFSPEADKKKQEIKQKYNL